MVRPDDSAVDHLNRLPDAFRVVECIQKEVTDTCRRPPTKLPIDCRPFTEEARQIAPLHARARDPKYPVENEPREGGGRYGHPCR
jgi:hypothetical protein